MHAKCTDILRIVVRFLALRYVPRTTDTSHDPRVGTATHLDVIEDGQDENADHNLRSV